MSDEVFIFYPNKQPDGHVFAYHRLPYTAGQDLASYLRRVRLLSLRKRAWCMIDGSSEVLRLSYIPKPGDRIVLRSAGRGLS